MKLTKEKRESLKLEALKECGVTPTEKFDVKKAIRDRIDYLKNYVRSFEMKGIVLGISGGVDSTTAGKLSQLAMSELREEGYEAHFVAVRLPHNVQKDEEEAQAALKFIKPDFVHTINIGESTKALNDAGLEEYEKTTGVKTDPVKADFHKGNIKARQRMVAQYHLAGLYGMLVLGTDHAAEYITGFFSKFADGACDLTVLSGLNKRQVRLCAKELGAAEKLWSKVPTADLEELAEQKPDETALGLTYEQIDDFLEGKEIEEVAEDKLMYQYMITKHKRALPVSPMDYIFS